MVGDTGLEPVRPFEQRILVEDRGAAPLIKAALFVSPLCLPIPSIAGFSINIISYFIEFVNIFAQVRRYKIVTKTNRVEV